MFNQPIGVKIANYFEIAAACAKSKKDERTFLLGAIGIRADQVMVKALNGPTYIPNRFAHAEYRLARKMTPNSVVYVVRILVSTGEFAMAKPCRNCVKMMKSRGVRRVYYTTGPTQYGVMDLD